MPELDLFDEVVELLNEGEKQTNKKLVATTMYWMKLLSHDETEKIDEAVSGKLANIANTQTL